MTYEVREHRQELSNNITPSARKDVDIKKTVHKFLSEDFYKDDYINTTQNLISDSISYEMIKDFLENYIEEIFKENWN